MQKLIDKVFVNKIIPDNALIHFALTGVIEFYNTFTSKKANANRKLYNINHNTAPERVLSIYDYLTPLVNLYKMFSQNLSDININIVQPVFVQGRQKIIPIAEQLVNSAGGNDCLAASRSKKYDTNNIIGSFIKHISH